MMKLEKAAHGFTCTMIGGVVDAEIDGYAEDAKRILPPAGGPGFGLIVDQRECKLLPPTVQQKMGEVIKFFRSRGLDRVAIICPTSVMSMQMNRIAASSAAAGIQFAINGDDSQWMPKALDWINKGVKS